MTRKNDVVSVLLLFLLPRAAAQATDPAAPPSYEYNLGPVFNPTMAIVMIILISAFFSLGFFSVYIRRCTGNRFRGGASGTELFSGENRRSWRAARGVGAEVVRSFPTFRYSVVKGVKIGKGVLECAVCLNEFEDDETLRLMPGCSHVFHPDCIDAWLGENCERFTLRLPKDVRSRMVTLSVNLNRTRSLTVLPRLRSERKGYRSGSVGSTSSGLQERFDRADQWGFSMVRPFFLRTGSVPSARSVGGGEETRTVHMSLLQSFRDPANRLFLGSDNIGERSSNRLRSEVNGLASLYI